MALSYFNQYVRTIVTESSENDRFISQVCSLYVRIPTVESYYVESARGASLESSGFV